MRGRKDPMDIAREKMRQIDPNTMHDLQSLAGRYSSQPVTPENIASFANSVDERTLNNLSQQLGVRVDRQLLRSLTPEKVQQLMQLIQENNR